MTLDVGERLALHELAAQYGNVVDERDWAGLGRVFTDDAVFVMTGFDGGDRRYEGLDAIRQLMTESTHPVAHHVTNVTLSVDDDEVVRLFFKVLGPGPGGRVGSADYRDVVRLTDAGWRIVEHRVLLRRPTGS